MNQLGKHDFSCDKIFLVGGQYMIWKEGNFFLIKWTEIVLTFFLVPRDKNLIYIIYRFYASVECQLRLLEIRLGKTLTLTKHEDMVLNSLTKTRER